MNKTFVTVALAVAAATAVPACAQVNPDAATIGTSHIKLAGFEKRIADLGKVPEIKKQIGDTGTAPIGLAQGVLAIEIRSELTAQELGRRGATLTTADISAQADAARQQYFGSFDPTSWTGLRAETRDLFTTFYARDAKLTEVISKSLTDDEITAFFNANKTATDPDLATVKDQVAQALASRQKQDALVAHGGDVKVDPRYGTFYPDTISFTSAADLAQQQAAAQAQQQAAQDASASTDSTTATSIGG